MEQLNLSAAVLDQIEALRQEAEREFDDDAESIITHERYQAISRILKTCYQKQQTKQRLYHQRIKSIRLLQTAFLRFLSFCAGHVRSLLSFHLHCGNDDDRLGQ